MLCPRLRSEKYGPCAAVAEQRLKWQTPEIRNSLFLVLVVVLVLVIEKLTRDGRQKEAIEAINLAITKNPAYAEAYFVRGACRYALGRYRQAGDDIDAAAVLGCPDAQFWSKHSINPLNKQR